MARESEMQAPPFAHHSVRYPYGIASVVSIKPTGITAADEVGQERDSSACVEELSTRVQVSARNHTDQSLSREILWATLCFVTFLDEFNPHPAVSSVSEDRLVRSFVVLDTTMDRESNLTAASKTSCSTAFDAVLYAGFFEQKITYMGISEENTDILK